MNLEHENIFIYVHFPYHTGGIKNLELSAIEALSIVQMPASHSNKESILEFEKIKIVRDNRKFTYLYKDRGNYYSGLFDMDFMYFAKALIKAKEIIEEWNYDIEKAEPLIKFEDDHIAYLVEN